MADIEITPKAGTPVAPEVQPQNNEGDVASPDAASAPEGLPPEVLQIPAMQALLAGKPAALSASLKEFSTRPEAKVIVQNSDTLQKAGFGLYKSLSGDLGVVFNQFHMHPEELVAADKAGKLTEIAPPFDQVNHATSKSGKDHPILSASEVPQGLKSAPMPNPPQAASPVTAPVPDQKQTQARLKNIAVGGPTTGARPGAGRLLNQIMKPVV